MKSPSCGRNGFWLYEASALGWIINFTEDCSRRVWRIIQGRRQNVTKVKVV